MTWFRGAALRREPRAAVPPSPPPAPPTAVRVTGPGGGPGIVLELEYAGIDPATGNHTWCGYGPAHQMLPDEFAVHLEGGTRQSAVWVALYQDDDGDVHFAPRGGHPGDPVVGGP